MKEKITRGELFLLGLTAVFLCGLLWLAHEDRVRDTEGVVTATEVFVPQEEIRPDVSPLDLNSATEAELTELPGVGEELARRIVKYRQEHGPFETVEEIMEVSGIGEGKFADLEDRITVKEGAIG